MTEEKLIEELNKLLSQAEKGTFINLSMLFTNGNKYQLIANRLVCIRSQS